MTIFHELDLMVGKGIGVLVAGLLIEQLGFEVMAWLPPHQSVIGTLTVANTMPKVRSLSIKLW